MKKTKFLSALVIGALVGAMSIVTTGPVNADSHIIINDSGSGGSDAWTSATADASGLHASGGSGAPQTYTSWVHKDGDSGDTLTMTGGSLTINSLPNGNDWIKASGGNITVNNGPLIINGDSYIQSAVNLTVNGNGIVNITGGSVELNSGDNISGTINATSGTFTVSGGDHNLHGSKIGSAVDFAVTGGTARFDSATNISTSFNNAGTVYLSGGILSSNISGNGTTVIDGTMTNDATIDQDVNVTGTLTNTGSVTGTTSIGPNATVNNTSGTLADVTNGGTLNVSGGSTDAITNNNALSITGGTVASVNNATASSTATQSAGTVTGTVTNAGTYTLSGTGQINGTTTNNGTFNVQGGQTAAITNNNALNMTGGTVASVNNATASSTATQSAGTVTGTVTNAGTYTLSGTGAVNGLVTNSNIFNLKNSGVADYAQSTGTLNITDGGSLTLTSSTNTITGGNVVLGEATDDTTGTLVVNNGLTTNQATVTTAGTGANAFSVTGANTVFTTLSGTNLASGSVTVGDGTNASVMNLSNNGIIADAITLTVAKGSKLNVDGATAQATISTGDTWNGDIEQSAGTITHLGSVVKNATDATYKVTGGNVNIGNNTTAGTLTLNNANDSIASAATVTINSNSKLSQSAGTVVLDNNNDNWNGAIELSGTGDLTLNGRTDVTDATKTFNQSGGTLNLEGSSLDLATSNSKITAGDVNIKNASTLTLENGSANTAKVVMSDGTASTLNILGANSELTTSAGTNLATGTINLGDGTNNSKLNLANDGIIAQAAALNIAKASELNISDTASAIIDNATDTYNGDVNMTNGSLEMKDLTVTTGDVKTSSASYTGTNPYYSQTGGALTMTNTNLSMVDSSLISGGDLTVDTNSTFNSLSNAFSVDNLTNAGLINGMNGGYENYAVSDSLYAGDTSGDKQGDFNVDLYARCDVNDNFKYDSFGSDGATIEAANGTDGVLNISDWSLNGDVYGWDAPIDRQYKMDKLFKGTVEDGQTIEFTATDKETFTPIGWYGLHSAGNGNYTFDLNRFNPGVFRGQVSKIAQYQNQLMIDDIIFSHTMLDQGFKGNDYIASNPNRIASSGDIFPPYQYSRKDGGMWMKMYGTFEKLNMNHGLNVGNNAYGTIIGADFGLKELKHGWQFMPTAYIGYNGAHQYWKGYGAYQNGGQLGVMGTWYKDNFIIGALAYGGVYNNNMDTPRGDDDSLGYFGGGAVKTAYNWRFAKDWSLQPNLLVAYNFFGKENWHTDFGQMGMMSGMLHGINIAPGVNLIWEKETFSIYGTLQYMYNVNQSVGGRAGHVGLPNVHMDRGYIQYGLGFNKRFGDRFSGFLQAVIRNVGRTGVGLQAGFQWQFGNAGSGEIKGHTPELKKTEIVLNSNK
ncbi:hypothetical protein IJ750_03870 [bacterium]|nr:hypothetical protein [bacterium]